MDKYIYDESNGLWYELQGDYYIPCLILSAEEERPIGIWGQRHKCYLKEYKNATYKTLLISGKLNSYLADINEQAESMLYRLVIKGRGGKRKRGFRAGRGRKGAEKGIDIRGISGKRSHAAAWGRFFHGRKRISGCSGERATAAGGSGEGGRR